MPRLENSAHAWAAQLLCLTPGFRLAPSAPRLGTHPSDSLAVSAGGVGGEKVGNVRGEFTKQAFWAVLAVLQCVRKPSVRQGGRCVNASGLESRARERCEAAAPPESVWHW